MPEVKLNQDIPGWNMLDIQTFLAKHVSTLPADAQILEIGALFGRTTYVLGHNKPATATLTTIDPWMTYYLEHFKDGTTIHDNYCNSTYKEIIEQHIKKDPDRIEGDDFFKLWKQFVGEVENLVPVRAFSPVKDREWPMFDFIYHDGPHERDDVYADLRWWFPKLKSSGIFVMDDYEPKQFAGLVEAVDTYVKENDLVTSMVGHRNIVIRRKE